MNLLDYLLLLPHIEGHSASTVHCVFSLSPWGIAGQDDPVKSAAFPTYQPAVDTNAKGLRYRHGNSMVCFSSQRNLVIYSYSPDDLLCFFHVLLCTF